MIFVKGYYRAQELKKPLKKQRVIKKECDHFWLPAEIDICDAQDSDSFRVTQVIHIKEVYCAKCKNHSDFWDDEE